MNEKEVIEACTAKGMIPFFCDVTDDSTARTREFLAMAVVERSRHLALFIDSKGGACEHALALYDWIKLLPRPVAGIVAGRCWSAAILVLQACSPRLATKNSRFLLHYPKADFRFSVAEGERLTRRWEKELRYGRGLNDRMLEILATRANKSKDEIALLWRNGEELEEVLWADEAREVGLIDEVIETLPFPFPLDASK